MNNIPHKSYIGKKFGRLTVLALCPELKKAPYWKEYCVVRCDCGRLKIVFLDSILSNKTTSCGCYAKERASLVNTKHGYTITRPRLYRIWENMRSRCNYTRNSSYKNYGGRGIKVYEQWSNYELFRSWALANGYKDTLTLDRIDVNGDYCPKNCRWITIRQQQRNKSTNHLLTLGGKTQCVVDWCEELNLNPNTLHKRLRMGWSVEKALLTPTKNQKRTKGEKNG